MSYWSKIKAAANPSDPLAQQKPQQPQATPQTPVQNDVAPQPQTTPQSQPQTPAPSQPQGNEVFLDPQKKERQRAGDLQSSLEPAFMAAIKTFIQHPLYEQYNAQNPKFAVGLNDFFNISDRETGKAWYKLLIQARDIPGIVPGKYSTPQAIRHWMGTPQGVQEIGSAIMSIVQNSPADFAEAVNAVAGKADSQYGGQGLSFNNKSKGKGGDESEMGANLSDKGHEHRLEQVGVDAVEPDPDYVAPGAEDVAGFWSKKTKSHIIAPEVSPIEQKETGMLLQLLANDASHMFHDILTQLKDGDFAQDPASPKQPNSYQTMDPSKRGKALLEAIKWPFQGISDSEKMGDAAMTNWQEYLVKYKGMDPQTVVQLSANANTPQGNQALQEAMYSISEDFFDESGENVNDNSPIFAFIRDKAKQYMEVANEIANTDKMMAESAFRPRVEDLQSFDRMAKVAAACAMREFRYKKIHSKAEARGGAGTALRRYAYLQSKIPFILDKIKRVTKSPTGTYVPFGDDEISGKKKFFHMGKDGNFFVRTIQFNDAIPLTNEADLKAYIEDPRNAPADEPLDEPLTMFNWAKVSGMVSPKDYVPGMLDHIKQIDPSSLRRQKVDKKVKKKVVGPDGQEQFVEESVEQSDLAKRLSAANDQYLQQNPQAEDRLAAYRQQLGQHVSQVMAQHGVDPEAVLAAVNASKKRMGPRLSNRRTNKAWLQKILSGQPEFYSKSDFDGLAKAISAVSKKPLAVEDLYEQYSTEYDKYNTDDYSDLTAQADTAPAVFGRYFVHRKRINLQRGFNQNNWSNKSIAAFLHMSKAHKLFSSYNVPSKNKGQGGPSSEATGVGGPLYDAINNEFPLHNVLPGEGGEPDQDITNPDQAQELINRMKKVPRTNIYNDLMPTSPVDEQLLPDGVDKGGKPKFRNQQVEADPIQMQNAILNSYKAANPDAANWGPSQIMQAMKEEKKQELTDAVTSRSQKVEAWQSLVDSGDPSAVLDAAQAHLFETDREIQHVARQNHAKGDTSPEAQQAEDEVWLRRWQEKVQKSGMDETEFAKAFLSNAMSTANAEAETLKSRLQMLESANPMDVGKPDPSMAKLPKDQKDRAAREKIRREIDLFVPMRYKRRTFSQPGEDKTPVSSQPSFTPLDHVKDVHKYDPTTASVDLAIKTARTLDRLASIKDVFERMAMPTEFVDSLIDSVGDEYERQYVIIARRADGRGGEGKNRRRLWSLL